MAEERNRRRSLTLLLVGMFGAEQVAWYNRLQPDTESQRAIACLNRAGIRLARGGYRQSYKITFLTDERIIVAPVDGLDRNATYAQQARVAPLLDATAACE